MTIPEIDRCMKFHFNSVNTLMVAEIVKAKITSQDIIVRNKIKQGIEVLIRIMLLSIT